MRICNIIKVQSGHPLDIYIGEKENEREPRTQGSQRDQRADSRQD